MKSRFTALAPLLIGNAFLLSPFIRALIDPRGNIHFIYTVAIMIFLIEFLSLHSSFMFVGQNKIRTRDKLFLFIVYAGFACMFGFIFHTIYPPLIFVVSLLSKILFARTVTINQQQLVFSILNLMATVFFVAIFDGTIKKIIPFPADVYAQAPVGSSGLFIEIPQTVLVWGILYYAIDTYAHIKLASNPAFLDFLSSKKKKNNIPPKP